MRAPVELISVTRRSSSSKAIVPCSGFAVDDLRQPLGAAEEQRALQLDDQHRGAPHMQHLQLGRIAVTPRAHGVAAIEPANIGAAHADDEQQHRQHDADEHREHDVDRDRQQRDEDRYAEVERDGAALRRAGLDQTRGQLFGPGIDVLDGDHHDYRRQHRARHIGENRKQ